MRFLAAPLGCVGLGGSRLTARLERQQGLDGGLLLFGRLQSRHERAAATRQFLVERVALVRGFFKLPGQSLELRKASRAAALEGSLEQQLCRARAAGRDESQRRKRQLGAADP